MRLFARSGPGSNSLLRGVPPNSAEESEDHTDLSWFPGGDKPQGEVSTILIQDKGRGLGVFLGDEGTLGQRFPAGIEDQQRAWDGVSLLDDLPQEVAVFLLHLWSSFEGS